MPKQNKRKIAVVTGTRAEYGIIKPLLDKIKASRELELLLLVTGMHMLRQYGRTISSIKKDGFKAIKVISMYQGSEQSGDYYGVALGRGIRKFTKVFLRMKPDMLLVTGDRLEPLAATLAAANVRIPIVHVHGGEVTNSGCIDESIRHAITRFAHIHLVSSRESRQRLIKMGEEPWRIFRVGALGQVDFLQPAKISKKALFKKFGLAEDQPLILCLFNPVIFEAEKMGRQMRQILTALKQLKMPSLIIYPNNDIGAKAIIKEINQHRQLPFIKIYPSLAHDDYVNLLKRADVLVGNSSSGIIEAPAIKLPVVNIGVRNTGREHAKNVIFVKPCRAEIVKAVATALYNKKFRRKLKHGGNPYGDAKTVEKIIKVLKKTNINKKLLVKAISY